MLASTALVAVGFASSASAQSVIDTSDGSMTVAAGLDGFVSATSQISTGTDVTAEVTAADSQINQTSLTDINTNQTIFGDAAAAVARLNQGTNTLTISAPEDIVAGTPTGSTAITASSDVTINAATGILSQQKIIGDAAGGDVTATTGATGAPVAFSIDLASPIVSGNVINSGNEAVADALANDVMNTLTVTGPGNGSLDSPAAIANLQTIKPGDTPNISAVTAGAYGDVTVAIVGAAGSITGSIGLDQNTVAGRAAANTAVNDLFAGSADSTAQGSLTGSLVSSAVETGGAIVGFVADFGIANLQMIDEGAADADNLLITSTVEGNVAFGVDAAAAISSPEISLRGNSILSDASGNAATNRGIVTTSGVNGVSVGIASLQEFDGSLAVNDVTATVTSGTVSFGGNVTDPTAAAGILTAVDVTLSDNEIGAAASGNEALNVAAVTSTGSLGGSQSYVSGRQVAKEVGISAVTTGADIIANVANADTGSTLVLNNNAVFSTAALNTQTNILQNSGASNLGRATMVSTSQQEITGGSSSALVTASKIAAIGTTDSLATGTLTGNTVLASATGNVSTSSITNRSSGFSFSR
jgi:hypothetical protein